MSVGGTATLAAGESARVENTGSTSAAVLKFFIPKGDKGEKGDPGSGSWSDLRPANGIPYSDMSSGVKESLDKADAAVPVTNGRAFDLSLTATGASETILVAEDDGHVCLQFYRNGTFLSTILLPYDRHGDVILTTSDLTKANVGLGNVDNTSDAAKPISTATQTALDGKLPVYASGSTAWDTAPTADSTKAVTSGGVYDAISEVTLGAIGAVPTDGSVSGLNLEGTSEDQPTVYDRDENAIRLAKYSEMTAALAGKIDATNGTATGLTISDGFLASTSGGQMTCAYDGVRIVCGNESVGDMTIQKDANGDAISGTIAYTADLPYKSASAVSDRRVAYYKVTAGTAIPIVLPEISSATAAGTSVVNVDIIIDAVGVTTLPSITINGATPTGASSPQAIYAPDGEIPEWEANAINVVSCVSVPALTAWVLLGATKLTAGTRSRRSARRRRPRSG